MILSKNRIKNILKSKNKKQTKKKLKRKKKRREKKYNSFRKKKKNLRLQTIKNHNKNRIAKKKRKAYIHTGGSTTKLNIDSHIVSSFNYFNNLNKYFFSNPYQSQFVLRGGGNGVKTRSQTAAEAGAGKTGGEGEGDVKGDVKAEAAREGAGEAKAEAENATPENTAPEDAASVKTDEAKKSGEEEETKEGETKQGKAEEGKTKQGKAEEKTSEKKEDPSEKKEDPSEVKEVGEAEIKEDSNNSSNNTEITFSDNTKKYGKYFPIQFLFNPVDKLKVKILNDDDVGKTTETNKEEEQKTEDKKEIKSIQDQSKGDGLDFLDGPSTCSNKMVRFGNNYGLYYRSPGDCEDDKNVYGTIANIMGII